MRGSNLDAIALSAGTLFAVYSGVSLTEYTGVKNDSKRMYDETSRTWNT